MLKCVLIFRTISRNRQKTDTTAQLYSTLSMYITSKTISCRNQKTNTTPQLYCTLSTWVCKPKPISHQNQKLTQHTAQLEKRFLQPTRSECIHFSVHPWFCVSVRAKRGILSKRVLRRTNGIFFRHALKDYYDNYSLICTCTESSRYFWETIMTISL